MNHCWLRGLLIAVLISARPANARDDHVHAGGARDAPQLGAVTFPNSGARGAQAPFVLGIALLHSFEYDDAAAAFRDAQRADPHFALPYWFEAFTNSHILWGEDDPAASRRALAKLGATRETRLASARTPRERAYGAAIEAFYADTSLAVRTRSFADSMIAVVTRWPTDLEATAFASIALQMRVAEGNLTPAERKADEERAIDLAERVFRANPNHPGAAHYLIHVSDIDAAFSSRALPAARAYAKIAPASEHALHMPSHVFLKLGLWDEVAFSNEKAWAASRAWVKQHARPNTDLDFHGFTWLQYAYLQQGRLRAARALIDTAEKVLADEDTKHAASVDAYYVVPRLRFAYAAETGRWDEASRGALVTKPVGPQTSADRERSFISVTNYGRAAAAAMRGDLEYAVAVVTALGGIPDSSRALQNPRPAMQALELEALILRARGDTARAITLLQRAGPLEDLIPIVGPPGLLSARELLGGMLFAAGRSEQAAAEYERALLRTPNRSAALLGLARARRAAGDNTRAADAYRRLLVNWKHADADLPALAEARKAVGAK